MDLLASIGHRCHDDTAVTIARATDLCDLLRMGRRPEAYLAPPEVRELRELVRHRAKLVALRSGLKAQVTRPGQFAAAADRGGRLRGRAGHQSAPGAAGPPPRLPDGADPARGRSDPGRWRCEAAYRMDLAPPTAGTRIRPAYSAPSRHNRAEADRAELGWQCGFTPLRASHQAEADERVFTRSPSLETKSQFTDEVAWDLVDFAVAGAVVLTCGND